MQIVVEQGGRQHEVDVRVNHPDAGIADLLEALGLAADTPAAIDGRTVDADTALHESGLARGSVLRIGPPPTASLPAVASSLGVDPLPRRFAVIGGLDAGLAVPAVPGGFVAGRGRMQIPLSSTTVSSEHARFDVAPDGRVTVRDLGSTNGTWIGDRAVVATVDAVVDPGAVVRLGAMHLMLEPVPPVDRPVGYDPARQVGAGATVLFNRPPRRLDPDDAARLRAPDAPHRQSGKPPFNVVMLLTPLATGAAFYALNRSNPAFLLITIVSPLMMGVNQITQRRSHARSKRKQAARYRDELAQLDRDLGGAAARQRSWLLASLPHAAEVMRRATTPSTRVWERRPGHADFLRLRVGLGTVPWDPPLDRAPSGSPDPDLVVVLDRHRTITEAPVGLALADDGVVGIVGDREAALAVARSLLVQLATHHGPADTPMLVLTSEAHSPAWDWAKWLPHLQATEGGGPRIVRDADAAAATARSLVDRAAADRSTSGRRVDLSFGGGGAGGGGSRSAASGRGASGDAPRAPLVVVVDDEELTRGRQSPVRSLLRGQAGPVAGIVIASTQDRLPALCTTVVVLEGADGMAVMLEPAIGAQVDSFLAAGVSDTTARLVARSLARFEDPELQIAGAGLPDMTRLLPLLGFEELDAAAVVERWRRGGEDPSPHGPIGVSESGVFALDLVRDGPHGLIAGTTGSGKSELLRSIVASMAANTDPAHLTFVLIDYKGGSAFLECAHLPHTVGMVTDLDASLGERALRCMEAELRYRERRLRDAGVSDLPSYLRAYPDGEPLPRLVLIVDEFATLKSELPEFMDAIVSVAQRGRSLGVHMILATQRPSGAISDNIRANTNLRIALRVQDASDSSDVIGAPDAASIPRGRAGRAYIRLGPGEIVPIQTALSTAAATDHTLAPVEVSPYKLDGPSTVARPLGGDGPTDLTRLVAAVRGGFTATHQDAPRRPWPDPLPTALALADVWADRPDEGDWVPVALADDPDRQAQYPLGWRVADGNLMVVGLVGSGVTTTLVSIAAAAARRRSPSDLHLYALDFGAGDLRVLEQLPHTGAVVAGGERERQVRLVRQLRDELDRRRSLDGVARRTLPRIMILLDGLATFRAEFDDAFGSQVLDIFNRLFSDGPEVAMVTVVTADRAALAAGPLGSLCRQKWAMRLPDRGDYSAVGARVGVLPTFGPGGAMFAEEGLVVQIGMTAPTDLTAIAASWPPPVPERAAARVGTLPDEVDGDALPAAQFDARPWRLPVGIREATLGPAWLEIYDGEHALVAGPARSGKSSVLVGIAKVLARPVAVDSGGPASGGPASGGGNRAAARLVVVAGPRSPVPAALVAAGVRADLLLPEELELLAGAVGPAVEPTFVLIDDADQFEDPTGVVAQLIDRALPGLVIVAAGRADPLRNNYGHWTRPLRRARLGVLLRPGDLDGELVGATLPRRPAVPMATARGFVVNGGEADLAQFAR